MQKMKCFLQNKECIKNVKLKKYLRDFEARFKRSFNKKKKKFEFFIGKNLH